MGNRVADTDCFATPEEHAWKKTCIQVDSGGWQRLEDYCNNGPKGTPFMYTSSILTIEDVVRDIELGDKAANQWLEKDVDGWDPLLDALMREMEAKNG